jgi:hypothetical protein
MGKTSVLSNSLSSVIDSFSFIGGIKVGLFFESPNLFSLTLFLLGVFKSDYQPHGSDCPAAFLRVQPKQPHPK